MADFHSHRWSPIEDLPSTWAELADPQVESLANALNSRVEQLKDRSLYERWLDELRREWAIETGIIERLYSLSEGATRTLIEHGLDAALIGHDDTDQPVNQVVEMIRDQYHAIEGLYQFVSDQRELSKSYIRELHQVITAHQESCDAVDSQGQERRVPLQKGAFKKWPNNPRFMDGTIFEYCPPEQVESELERMLAMSQQHDQQGISPEVEAAWLHHRFVLIHPFQDGNGRIARCLATLQLLKRRRLPLVIVRHDRSEYLNALRAADDGELLPLVKLVSHLQIKRIQGALEASERVESKADRLDDAFRRIAPRLQRASELVEARHAAHSLLAEQLHDLALQSLTEVQNELRSRLGGGSAAESAIRLTLARSGDRNSRYHRWQVVECARQLGYFANLTDYHAWALLTIRTQVQTELLVSIHRLGRNGGIFAASAMIYRRESQGVDASGNEAARCTIPEPLCRTPFTVTDRDLEAAVSKRFQSWIDECVEIGLGRWADWV